MAKDAAAVPRRAGKPSIYDVAELAGVSHQTVSRVLNDHPNIRESTRQRVIEAMAQVRYTPNSIARALATSRTKRIGVLVDSPEKYGPGSTMRGIEEAAHTAGYAVIASTVGDDSGLDVDAAVAHLRVQGVDALCAIAPRYSTLDALRHATDDVPVLLVKSEPEEHVLTVAVDQYAGGVLAVDHLLSLGHRDILHLAGPLDWVDARQRSRAYADRIAMEGFEVRAPIIGDWSSDFGYRVGRHAPEIDEVTAVFAANDQMALGLLHGLHERGLRVPDDFSVIGFDDLPDARHFLPPLSTIRQDFHALGALAITSLIAALEGDAEVAGGMIEPRLVARRSTAQRRRPARA